MSIGYGQARADHEYLWRTYGPAWDMTGGYVDSKDLDALLLSPTKATARDCYCSQIEYWFQAGPETMFGRSGGDWCTDRRVKDIARRHRMELPPHDMRERVH